MQTLNDSPVTLRLWPLTPTLSRGERGLPEQAFGYLRLAP